jgi:hypothetical protein
MNANGKWKHTGKNLRDVAASGKEVGPRSQPHELHRSKLRYPKLSDLVTPTRPLPLVSYRTCPNLPAHHPTCYAKEDVLLSKKNLSGEAIAIASKGQMHPFNFSRPGVEHIA